MLRVAVVTLVALLFHGTAQAETIDNPEFAQWSKFKVGAMVTQQMLTKAASTQTKVVTTTTLKSKAADKLVLTTKSTTYMKIPGLGDQKHEAPAEDRTVPAKIQKMKPPAGTNVPKPVITQGEETLKIAGKQLKCKWTQITTTIGAITSIAKTWTSPEVPGHQVKMTSATKGSVSTSTEVIVTSFKAP